MFVPNLPHCFYGQATGADGQLATGQVSAVGVGTLYPDPRGGNPVTPSADGKWGYGLWARKLLVQPSQWASPLVVGQPIYFFVGDQLAEVETPEGWRYSWPFRPGDVTEIKLRI